MEDGQGQGKRIGSLESNVQALSHTVGSLESDVRNIVQSVNDLAGMVRELARNDKTNWGVLASWASAIIALLGVFGYLALTPLQKRTDIAEVVLREHLMQEWHPGAKISMDAMSEEIKLRHEVLQSQILRLQERQDTLRILLGNPP